MNKKIIFASTIILILIVVIFSLKNDNTYLYEKEADNIWEQFLPTLSEIIRKGDYLVYSNIEQPSLKIEHDKKAKTFINRFSYHVGVLNIKNTPKMRKTFQIQTQFREFKDKTSIEFTITDSNTNELIERKIFLSKKITWTCLLPALMALILSFYLRKPLLGLFISTLLGSIIYNSNSIFIGSWELITNYIPSGIIGNNSTNINILLFVYLMFFSSSLLAYIGSDKKNKKFLSKYFPIFLSGFHPYLFSSFGSWWIKNISSKGNEPYKYAFIAHTIAVTLPTLFLFSPYLIFILLYINTILSSLDINMGLTDIYTNILKYKFFTLSMFIVFISFILFNNSNKLLKKEIDLSLLINFKSKLMVKPVKNFALFFIIILVILFSILGLTSGILNKDFNNNFSAFFELSSLKNLGKTFNKYYLLSYLSNINISFSLLVSSLLATLCLVGLVLYKSLTSIKEVFLLAGKSFKANLGTLFFLVISFALTDVLKDMGTIYYIISLFKVEINSFLFPIVTFFLAFITGLCLGNTMIVVFSLSTILIPLAAQLGEINTVMLTIAAIIEGGIAGELLCPYSQTSVISSSVFNIPSSKHIQSQAKLIGIAIVSSSILGFFISGTDIPLWLSYVLISVFGFILLFRKKTNRFKG